MKSIKRLFSLFLGVLTLFTCTQNAFAEIEMWTFNDGTRVSRFKYTDIDDMIAFYENLVQENEKRKFTKGQNTAIKISGIGAGLCSLIGSGALIYSCVTSGNTDNTNELKEKLGAGILGLIGILSIIASFYPEYVNHKVKKANMSDKKINYTENGFDIDTGFCWLGLEDICTLLNLTKNKIDELRANGVENLVKTEQNTWCNISGTYKLIEWNDLERNPYFMLVERPKSAYTNGNYHCPTGIYFGCQFIADGDADLKKKLASFLHKLKTSENLKIVNKGLIIKSTVCAIDNK